MEDWQEVEFDKIGPWNIGNIIVNDLKAGEYTLAVKESAVGSFEPDLPGKTSLDILSESIFRKFYHHFRQRRQTGR